MPNRRPPQTPPAAPRARPAPPERVAAERAAPERAASGGARPRPKSTVLVVRISPEDRAVVEEAAAAHELETSTWVRQTVVLAAKRWKARQGGPDSTAEP